MAPSVVKTEGFDPDVTWTPFIDGPMVGYIVRRVSDGAETRVYMNPSSSGDGAPDVFIYKGRGDPSRDMPVTYIQPTF